MEWTEWSAMPVLCLGHSGAFKLIWLWDERFERYPSIFGYLRRGREV